MALQLKITITRSKVLWPTLDFFKESNICHVHFPLFTILLLKAEYSDRINIVSADVSAHCFARSLGTMVFNWYGLQVAAPSLYWHDNVMTWKLFLDYRPFVEHIFDISFVVSLNSLTFSLEGVKSTSM